MKTTYVLNEKGELVVKGSPEDPKARYYVQNDIESFISPLDGSIIHSRSDYRDHMRRHGVVPSADYSPEYLEKRREEQMSGIIGKRASEERKRAIAAAIERSERTGPKYKTHLDFVLGENARRSEGR